MVLSPRERRSASGQRRLNHIFNDDVFLPCRNSILVSATILRRNPLFDMSLQPATPAPALLNDLLTQAGLAHDGRPVFLNFFRSDCPWCASEIPRLSEIYARHTDLHLHILGVAVGEDSSQSATAFAQNKALSFPIVVDNGGALKTAFGIERVPAVVAVNGQGLVERTYEGATEQLTGIVEQTLFALAHSSEPPEYDMIGNGCAP